MASDNWYLTFCLVGKKSSVFRSKPLNEEAMNEYEDSKFFRPHLSEKQRIIQQIMGKHYAQMEEQPTHILGVDRNNVSNATSHMLKQM